ncbi:MAG: bifunctional response regulator/alkaline phosphatase family protein [Flavobacteriales bacterium]|jgi:CheY-like chemotaxis protein|nr:bifunctional response regulator/alkaline phosphatase family protein [Flavobacteriales bacterium]
MENIKILWADDEIDLLKPHVMFLEQKGFTVETVNNGDDAIDIVNDKNFDIVFLDENMPGISGLEALTQIKAKHPLLPIIMITKSEEESIMEEAIGSKISDYLIKPVNPNQILLSVKRNLDSKRLRSEKSTSNYQQEFREIAMTLSGNLSIEEWGEIYKKLVYWELELENGADESMTEILTMQKQEANAQFFKFIQRNYIDWLNSSDEAPIMSHTLFKERIAPQIEGNQPVFLLLIDNLRYDQWKMIRPLMSEFFNVDNEELFYSILPTATQYSRNALFAGLMPSEIESRFPKLWKNENEEGGKNMHEDEFLKEQLKRLGKNVKSSYNKITNHAAGKRLVDNFNNLQHNDFNVIVYNFVDMLSHARTDMEVIRELADDEAAYRSLTVSWFEHSPLFDIIKKIHACNGKILIATDHGTVRVKEPAKVIGDKNTNTNLRYKVGKNLQYSPKDVFEVRNPDDIFLPKTNVSSTYLFAREDKFFAYPNNFNHYVKFYRDTFQHGGISMEEMLIPFVELSPK